MQLNTPLLDVSAEYFTQIHVFGNLTNFSLAKWVSSGKNISQKL